ncbi:hypothetical protein SLA2020_410760 [Shorea laevis]
MLAINCVYLAGSVIAETNSGGDARRGDEHKTKNSERRRKEGNESELGGYRPEKVLTPSEFGVEDGNELQMNSGGRRGKKNVQIFQNLDWAGPDPN